MIRIAANGDLISPADGALVSAAPAMGICTGFWHFGYSTATSSHCCSCAASFFDLPVSLFLSRSSHQFCSQVPVTDAGVLSHFELVQWLTERPSTKKAQCRDSGRQRNLRADATKSVNFGTDESALSTQAPPTLSNR